MTTEEINILIITIMLRLKRLKELNKVLKTLTWIIPNMTLRIQLSFTFI